MSYSCAAHRENLSRTLSRLYRDSRLIRGFESKGKNSRCAPQSGEHLLCKQRVRGSSLVIPTKLHNIKRLGAAVGSVVVGQGLGLERPSFGAFSGLQQFEAKAFLWRLATYPIAALVVPIIWTTLGRRPTYPFAADLLLTLPFLIDTAGNALDLYDAIEWWDNANHLVNWTLLSGAVGVLAWRNSTGRCETLAFVVGFGAVSAIVWEVAEYFAFIRHSSELATAYSDTLGDLALGLTGSVSAGVAAALAPHRYRQLSSLV